MGWQALLGWLGSALFVMRLVPQPVRLWRTGVSHGVSPLSILNATVSDCAWLSYGLAAGLPPVWICAALAIPLDLWTMWLLRREINMRHVVTSALWALLMLTAWIVGENDGLGSALAFSVLINNGPQVWAALRGERLGGIAPATWLFALADATLWGGYGLAVRDGALMSYGAILFTASVVVLFRLWQVGGSRGLRPDLSHGLPDPIENL